MRRVKRNKIFTNLDLHSKEVFKKSGQSIIVKIFGALSSFFLSATLGQILGTENFGVFSLFNKYIAIATIISLFGMRQVIIKEVAIARGNEDLIKEKTSLKTAFMVNGFLSLFLTLTIIYYSEFLSEYFLDTKKYSLLLSIFSLAILPQVFSRIFSSGLIAYRKIWQSNLVDNSLSSVLTLIGIGILFLIGVHIDLVIITISYLVARIIVLSIVFLFWKKFKNKNRSDKDIKFNSKLIKTALPIFSITSIGVLSANAGIFILSYFLSSTEVGLFNAAFQIALLTNFFLQATNTSISPTIAALYDQKKESELERMIQRVTLVLILLGLLAFIFYILFGKYILTLWGAEFIEAYTVLIILSAGQLVNVSTGAVHNILIMTGHEVLTNKIHVITGLFSIILNFFLIYTLGLVGAAISTSFIIISENLIKLYFVRKKVGISTLKI